MSPGRASPRTAAGKASPTNNKKVASPKASPRGKATGFNGTGGKTVGAATGGKSAYNSTTSARKRTDGAVKSNNLEKAPASKSRDSSSKIKPNTYSTNNSQT